MPTTPTAQKAAYVEYIHGDEAMVLADKWLARMLHKITSTSHKDKTAVLLRTKIGEIVPEDTTKPLELRPGGRPANLIAESGFLQICFILEQHAKHGFEDRVEADAHFDKFNPFKEGIQNEAVAFKHIKELERRLQHDVPWRRAYGVNDEVLYEEVIKRIPSDCDLRNDLTKELKTIRACGKAPYSPFRDIDALARYVAAHYPKKVAQQSERSRPDTKSDAS